MIVAFYVLHETPRALNGYLIALFLVYMHHLVGYGELFAVLALRLPVRARVEMVDVRFFIGHWERLHAVEGVLALHVQFLVLFCVFLARPHVLRVVASLVRTAQHVVVLLDLAPLAENYVTSLADPWFQHYLVAHAACEIRPFFETQVLSLVRGFVIH